MTSGIEAIQWLTLLLCFAPFPLYKWKSIQWIKKPMPIPNDQFNGEHIVLLPVWNEEFLIERKLEDLVQQGVEFKLVIIDSASTDATLSRARQWINENQSRIGDIDIIEMSERKGKTAAVALFLQKYQEFDGLITMTDADATFMPEAIMRVRKWFSDETIGAVGARPSRKGEQFGENQYRSIFDSLRYAESCYDSTPFLEGSMITWRSKLVDANDLFIQSNADDAQISVQVRKKGYRAVQDKELLFFDEIPLSKKSQAKQKIRRAQGLLRLLVRERKLLFNRKYGRFSQIMRWQMWMFALSPLFLMMFFSFGIIRKFTLPTNNLFDVLFYVEILILFSWSFRRFNHSKQEWNILGSILVGLEYLCWSMVYILSGKSLHMWDQIQDVRQESK